VISLLMKHRCLIGRRHTPKRRAFFRSKVCIELSYDEQWATRRKELPTENQLFELHDDG
jgi:hypothetical protein